MRAQGRGRPIELPPPVRWRRLKQALARVIRFPSIGQLIGWLYGDVIPFHGIFVSVCDAGIPPANKAAIRLGMYESAEYRMISTYLRPDLPVIELGSSIGAISSVIARRLERGQRLLCVEPSSQLIPVLKRNLAANAAHLQTTVIHGAIAYHAATVRFHVAVDNLTSQRGGDDRSTSISVPAVALRTLINDVPQQRYQLVADVEGSEIEILLQDAAALQGCQVIVIELHDTSYGGENYTVDDQVLLLADIGFRILERYGSVVACCREVSEVT